MVTKKERQLTINENLKKLDSAFNFKEGVVKINKHNSLKYELSKFLVAYELMKNGLTIYTECKFNNGKIADIYNPYNNQAYEITESESKESMVNKENCYPCKVSFLKADDVIKENLKWLKN